MSIYIPAAFITQLVTRKQFAFAGNSLLLYDYFLTFSLEVTYIWNEPWSLVKSLFLINRYGSLIGQTFIMLEETGYLSHGSERFCIAFQLYCAFFAVLSGETVRLFVVMRTCAILECRRRVALVANVLYVLYGLSIFAVSAAMVLLHLDVIEFEFLNESGVCIIPVGPGLWMFWFIPLVLDGTMFAIGWYKLYRWTRGMSPSPLMALLVRDGTLFYIAALFNVLLCMICWTVLSLDPTNFIQLSITYPILSVAGQRLVLNLRSFGTKSESTGDISVEINRQIEAMQDVELAELH